MKHFIHVICLVSLSAFIPIFTQASNLDTKLTESESAFTDIVEGAEKLIRWHTPNKTKTPYSFVYLHGFSASRQELSPTTELLADKIGANVFYTRLTGHGRSDDAMAQATVASWKQDAKEALDIAQEIGDKVIVVSASTGGTLATWLQAEVANPRNIAASIMVSPNFGVKSSAAKILNWPMGLTIAKWFNGDYNSFTPVSDKHAKFWTERYPLEAVVPMLDLVEQVAKLDKSQIQIPQLFIYSPQDMVVDVKKIESTAKEFTSSRVAMYRFTESKDHVQHVLSGDACSPSSTAAMVNLMVAYIENNFAL